MNADDFRRLALTFPGTEEKAHMAHPDFRVGGKIFASLTAIDDPSGMVKVSPAEQAALLAEATELFEQEFASATDTPATSAQAIRRESAM